MRVLRAALLLFPMLAFAGWRQIGTMPLPISDVQVVDAGVVLAVSSSTTMGAATVWKVSDAGVTQLNTLAGGFIGAGYFGANCLVGVANLTRFANFSPGCGVDTQLAAGGTAVRFRLLTADPLGIAVLNNTANLNSTFAGPAPDGGWAMVGAWGGSATVTLQTARVGGVDYAVMNSVLATASVQLSIDGGPPAMVAGLSAGYRDVAPFSLDGAPALILVLSTGGALTLIPDVRTPAVTMVASRDAGVVARYVSMSRLTGMATTATGAVIGPIPDPARPAQSWMFRSSPPVALTDRINCLDDRWCATVDIATGNVWYWENEVPPAVAVAIPQLQTGQTIRLVADAGDGDGDPIHVSWSTAAAGTLTAVPGVDDGTQVDLTAGAGCTPANIAVTVRDGLPGHDVTTQIPVTILERGQLQLVPDTSPALAGGPALVFTSFIDGGCVSGSLSWNTSEGQTGSGSQFNWTPPCSVDGGPITITSTATWSSGLPPTTSASQLVSVQGWVTPDAPSFTSPVTQQSGTVVDYLATAASHACSASNGFPGLELEWTIDAGGLVPAPTPIDGGLRIDAPAGACLPVQVTASAIRRVAGEAAGSDAGTLVVDILPDIPPLDSSAEFAITVQGDGGVVFGILKLDAGCLPQRSASAEITVSQGGVLVASRDGGFPIVGEGATWALPLAGGCNGGTYDVLAELYEDGGFTGATDQGSITLLFTPARVGQLSADRLDVVCGEGARLPLTLVPEPNSCALVDLSWRAIGGPALVTMTGQGDTLQLQSEALDFSVVGQQIALEWVADAGAGNLDVATRTIELSVQPFLEVSVQNRPPLRREEEALTLEVTLKNTTACAVEGLSLTLPLSSATPFLDSVLIDDVLAPAQATADGVNLEGVTVPGSGETKIQLRVRPRLLSSPSVLPVASLNGFVVSTPTAIPDSPRGCGCSGAGAPAFFGLLALFVLRRRRRSPG